MSSANYIISENVLRELIRRLVPRVQEAQSEATNLRALYETLGHLKLEVDPAPVEVATKTAVDSPKKRGRPVNKKNA